MQLEAVPIHPQDEALGAFQRPLDVEDGPFHVDRVPHRPPALDGGGEHAQVEIGGGRPRRAPDLAPRMRVAPRVPAGVGEVDRRKLAAVQHALHATAVDGPDAVRLCVHETPVADREGQAAALDAAIEDHGLDRIRLGAGEQDDGPPGQVVVLDAALLLEVEDRVGPQGVRRVQPDDGLALWELPVELDHQGGDEDLVHRRAGKVLLCAVSLAWVRLSWVPRQVEHQRLRMDLAPLLPSALQAGEGDEDGARQLTAEAVALGREPEALGLEVAGQGLRVEDSAVGPEDAVLVQPTAERVSRAAALSSGVDDGLPAHHVVQVVVHVHDEEGVGLGFSRCGKCRRRGRRRA